MLSIIEFGKDEYEFPALLVLGCFDAIHVGHRELLKKAKLQAKINGLDLGIMMFRDGKNGKLLYSFEERCEALEKLNVKFVLAVDFNDEFKAIAPIDFLHTIEDKINVKAYMSGKDFRFGALAKGKSSTLKNYAEDEENGVWYMPVKDVELGGEKVSTSLIKTCLAEGSIAKANALLGDEFYMSGEVVKGAGRGTSVVGFPTVNIFYPEWKHDIKHGVYSVKCSIDGEDYTGIANYGTCPTFGDNRVALEVYFENFSGDLYGRNLTIRFVDYIRDIEEFASAEALSEQLQTDLNSVNGELVIAEAEEQAVAEEHTISEEQAVAEEHTISEEQAVAEEHTISEEQAVAEEHTISEEQAVVEEQPVEEEAVVEEQPVEEEAAVEEQPVEEEAVVVEPTAEEDQAVVEEPTLEEQPAEAVEEIAVEDGAETVAEQPEEIAEEQVEGEARNIDGGEQNVD